MTAPSDAMCSCFFTLRHCRMLSPAAACLSVFIHLRAFTHNHSYRFSFTCGLSPTDTCLPAYLPYLLQHDVVRPAVGLRRFHNGQVPIKAPEPCMPSAGLFRADSSAGPVRRVWRQFWNLPSDNPHCSAAASAPSAAEPVCCFRYTAFR